MPTVSELKERARGFEQRGELATALKVYRHILTHLEGTPALAGEIALYVKVGDLCAKLGATTDAVEMYRRAGAHFAESGVARRLVALAEKIERVDPSSSAVYGAFAHALLEHGFDEPAAEVLEEGGQRSGLDRVRAAVAWARERPAEESRGVLFRLADAFAESGSAAEREAETILAPPGAASPAQVEPHRPDALTEPPAPEEEPPGRAAEEIAAAAPPEAPPAEEPEPAWEPEPEPAPDAEFEEPHAVRADATPDADQEAAGAEPASAEAEREGPPEPGAEPEPEPEAEPEPAESRGPPILWSPHEERDRERAGAREDEAVESAAPSRSLEVTPDADRWRQELEQVKAPMAAEATPSGPPDEPAPETEQPEGEPAEEAPMGIAAAAPEPPSPPDRLELAPLVPSSGEVRPVGGTTEQAPEAPPDELPAEAPAELAPEPASAADWVPRMPARSASVGRVLVDEREGRPSRVWRVAAALLVVGAGVAAAVALDLLPGGGPPDGTAGSATVPADSGAQEPVALSPSPLDPGAPLAADTGALLGPAALPNTATTGDTAVPAAAVTPAPAASPPPDTARPLPSPPVVAPSTRDSAPVPAPVAAPDTATGPPTVRVPPGAPLGDLLIVVDGLPVESVTVRTANGRSGHRVVQRLGGDELLVLNSAPMSGPDTVGVSEVRVTVAGDTTVGSVRYWSFLVTARARADADTVARLLRRLTRARPVN